MFKSLGFNSSAPPRGLQWRSGTKFIVFTVGMGAFVDLFLYGLIVSYYHDQCDYHLLC